jgi:hypothetical protein
MGLKYGWGKGIDGLPIRYSLIATAIFAKGKFGDDRNILLVTKRKRKNVYMIDPERALDLAKLYNTFYTDKKEKQLYILVPQSECQEIELV